MSNNTDTKGLNDKQKLLTLIVKKGILHDSDEQPIVSRDGKVRIRWVMNFLAISLHYAGLQLAAKQMLTLLSRFKSKQIATIGTAAVPLLAACILESKGQYKGLMVRSKRKTYGTASLIDGEIDRSMPVIIIDDSIGSGSNMLDCIKKLEAAGATIEGCASFVRFGYDSGYARLLEEGYHVETLFDQIKDLSPLIKGEPQQALHPIKEGFKAIVWSKQTVPDYYSPLRVIRMAIEHYWKTNELLRPPSVFNQTLNTEGGAWISLRMQDLLFTPQERQGFFHFPDEPNGNAPEDILKLAWLLAVKLKQDNRQHVFDFSALGLSVLTRLKACKKDELNVDEHGIVIRSKESPWKMGGGLPNMPGIKNSQHLLKHACQYNTQLRPLEAYDLYKCHIYKLVEGGAEWPLGGETKNKYDWTCEYSIIEPIINLLSQCSQLVQRKKKLPDEWSELFIPPECDYIFLSVLEHENHLACVGMKITQSSDLLRLVNYAAQDKRWKKKQGDTAILTINLSLLSERQYLGKAIDLKPFSNWVLGQDAISIQHEELFALMLPDSVITEKWDVGQLTKALYAKSGIKVGDSHVHWCRYSSITWRHCLGSDKYCILDHEKKANNAQYFKFNNTQTIDDRDALTIKKGSQPMSYQGQFYLANKLLLRQQVKHFIQISSLQPLNTEEVQKIKVAVVPHAGYVYSGGVAGDVYAALQTRKSLKRIVILAPNHKDNKIAGVISQAKFFQTPLGYQPVDQDFIKQYWAKLPFIDSDDDAYKKEYSIEVQLPFIYELFPNVAIAPLLIGRCTRHEIELILHPAWDQDDTLIIISSDLYHYLDKEAAVQTGVSLTHQVEQKRMASISAEQACGYQVLRGLHSFIQKDDTYWRTLTVTHSGRYNGKTKDLVGYGGFLLFKNLVS